MGPNDIVNVMFFNDRAVVRDSKWLAKKGAALTFMDSVPGTFPAQGRTRQLFQIIKQAATDGFRELGNAGSRIDVPMHQAMVVLSNGVSGSDIGSPAQSALLLKQYMTKGRFPEDNKTLPKSPVPIVSVSHSQNGRGLPERTSVHGESGEQRNRWILQHRSKDSYRAKRIVEAVRRRFDQMHIVNGECPASPHHWATFKLVFKKTNPLIAGDNFENVPVGIDPSSWPLDIDIEATKRAAKKSPIYPGGELKVFGNFVGGLTTSALSST